MDTVSPRGGHSDLREFITHGWFTMAVQHAPLLSLLFRFRKLILYILMLVIMYCMYISTMDENGQFAGEQGAKVFNITRGDGDNMTVRTTDVCLHPRFASVGEKLPRTAIASFPGTGSTWARHLIEMMSGIYTGSVYHDPELKLHFPGESIGNTSVIAVKTHWPVYPSAMDHVPFDKVILTYRDPLDAIRSSFMLHVTGENHTGVVTRQVDTSGWSQYVTQSLADWDHFFNSWINKTRKNNIRTFILKYEDMKRDLETSVRQLALFLDLHPSTEVLECTLRNQEGHFHRDTSSAVQLPYKVVRSSTALIEQEINRCLHLDTCMSSSNQVTGVS